MKKKISKLFLCVLLIQLFEISSFAQGGSGKQFERPLGGGDSGMSFRRSDLQFGSEGAKDQPLGQDMMTKGMIMTEPSMSGLTYQVHVLGEIKSPGTYRITASDRLSEVLTKAGGLNEAGSQRNIEVRRKGERVKLIDIVEFQVFGDLADNPYLLDNDVIYIPLKGPSIEVVGAVKRPREYELKKEKNLIDAINLAGGLSVGVAKNSPVRIVRFVDGKKEVIEVASNEDALADFKLKDGDIIFVPHMITEKNKFDYDVPKLPGDNIFYPSYEDRVFILGGVVSPGAYPFNPYYSLPQYLSLAGGTTKMATGKVNVLTPGGKNKRLKKKEKNSVIVNPGDTILVGERRIPPEGWIGIATGLAGFGLSTTATVLALTK